MLLLLLYVVNIPGLSGTDIQEGVPTIEEFLEQNIQQGQTLGFDGRVIAAMDGKKYEKVLAKAQICIAYEKDLADSIWTDRPNFPAG